MKKRLNLIPAFLLLVQTALGALSSDVLWEIQVTGGAEVHASAGGGFDAVSGVPGTDYTYGGGQALTTWLPAAGDYTNDLAATDAALSILSSASRNFVAADVGNVINLTAGTNLTAGRYQIMSVAANAATLDRNCSSGGAVTAASGYLGGAMTLTDANVEDVVDGNVIWIKAGTHVLAANIIPSNPATKLLAIWVEGYGATRGDAPSITDGTAPLISVGANYFGLNTYWNTKYLRVTGTGSYAFRVFAKCVVYHCHAVNTTTTAAKQAIYAAGNYSIYVGVNASCLSANTGTALLTGNYSQVVDSFFYDSHEGLDGGISNQVTNTVFDNCEVGFHQHQYTSISQDCTFVNCTIGIHWTANYDTLVANRCLFDSCTTGVSATTANVGSMLVFGCIFNNCGTEVSNVYDDASNITADPGLTKASWTDLACADHAGPPYDLTSAAAGFSAAFAVNDQIRITNTGDGGHFTVGLYVIDSVADGLLGLHTDPTDGTNDTGGEAAAFTDYTPSADGNAQVDVEYGASTTSKGYLGAVTPAGGAGGGGYSTGTME